MYGLNRDLASVFYDIVRGCLRHILDVYCNQKYYYETYKHTRSGWKRDHRYHHRAFQSIKDGKRLLQAFKGFK